MHCHNTIAQRRTDLMQRARAWCDGCFEPRENLLHHTHPNPDRNGFVVAQWTLEYAITLLETATGEADIERANAILARVLEFQVTDKSHPRYGNFIWMSHWSEPLDPNAVSFMTPNLTYIWRRHREKLSADVCTALEASLPLCAEGLRRHAAPFHYTNIKALNTLSYFLLADVLDDKGLEGTARFEWKHWMGHITHFGIAEYNSPTYSPVLLFALEQLWQYGPEDMKPQFERVLEFCYFEFAVRYHAPSGMIGGALSRAYPADVTTGQGLAAIVTHLQWGEPLEELPSVFAVNWLLAEYSVPAWIHRLALEKPLPLEMKADCYDSERIRRTDYFAPEYSLGSQDGYYGNQEVPLFITVKSESKRRGVWLSSTAPGRAKLSSQQHGNQVAGYYYFDVQMLRDWLRGAPDAAETPLELVLNLGDREAVPQIHLDGRSWPGEACVLAPQSTLVVHIGSALVGLRVWSEGASSPCLQWEDDELRLRVPIGGASGIVDGDAPRGMNFYVRVEGASESTPEELHCHLERVEHGVTHSVPAQGRAFTTSDGDRTFHAQAAPPPLLHDSPLLQIRPNDLLRWLRGEATASLPELLESARQGGNQM